MSAGVGRYETRDLAISHHEVSTQLQLGNRGLLHCGPTVLTISCDHCGWHPRECAGARGKEKPLKRFQRLTARHTPN